MDQKSDQRKELNDLPKSEDEFWKGADKHILQVNNEKCLHEFAYSRITQGVTAQCMKCKSGFILDKGMEIKNKHIYLHGSFVI